MFLSHLRAVARQKRPAADRLTVVLKGEGGRGEKGEVAEGGGAHIKLTVPRDSEDNFRRNQIVS